MIARDLIGRIPINSVQRAGGGGGGGGGGRWTGPLVLLTESCNQRKITEGSRFEGRGKGGLWFIRWERDALLINWKA
jgi:hypothetical protein